MADDERLARDEGSESGDDQMTQISSDRGGSGARETVKIILMVVLAVPLVVALAGVVYIALTSQQTTDPYTGCYILGAEGNASDYSISLCPR